MNRSALNMHADNLWRISVSITSICISCIFPLVSFITMTIRRGQRKPMAHKKRSEHFSFYLNGWWWILWSVPNDDEFPIIIIFILFVSSFYWTFLSFDSDIDYLDTWKAMEKLVDLGIVKCLGVSNFNSVQVDRILKEGRIKPITNQVECLPTYNQKKLIKFCKERDIVVVAYLPLGHPVPAKKTPAFLYDEKLHAIARKHNKSAAQIVLRYLVSILRWKNDKLCAHTFMPSHQQVELGAVPIPKSVNENRLLENISIFDFQLDADDTRIMDNFHTGKRIVGFSDAKKARYWPFGIDFWFISNFFFKNNNPNSKCRYEWNHWDRWIIWLKNKYITIKYIWNGRCVYAATFVWTILQIYMF